MKAWQPHVTTTILQYKINASLLTSPKEAFNGLSRNLDKKLPNDT